MARSHPEKKKIIMQMEKGWSFIGGSILMDAPVKNDNVIAALVEFAKDKEPQAWQIHTFRLKLIL